MNNQPCPEAGLYYREAGLYYREAGLYYPEARLYYREAGLYYPEARLYYREAGLYYREAGLRVGWDGTNEEPTAPSLALHRHLWAVYTHIFNWSSLPRHVRLSVIWSLLRLHLAQPKPCRGDSHLYTLPGTLTLTPPAYTTPRLSLLFL